LLAVFALLGVLVFRGSGGDGGTTTTAVPLGYAGSGEIRGSSEKDVYTFSGPGKPVSLVSQPVDGRCPEFGGIGWKLVQDESGQPLFDNSMVCDQPLGKEGSQLKAGDYTLTVYGAKGATGAYRFALRSR